MKEPTLEEIKALVTFSRDFEGDLEVLHVNVDVEGDVWGNVKGDVKGDVKGEVYGYVYSRTSNH